MNKKYVLGWEDSALYVFDRLADAEEMMFSHWEGSLYEDFYASTQHVTKVEYYIKKILPMAKRDAGYGYWIEEVPYFN